MKKLVVFFFFALLGLGLNAQEKSGNKSGAQIEFKEETIDYGKIERGSDGVRVFEFTNNGTAPLIITNVRSSCGCTVPKKPTAPIAPGKKGKIEVKYDTNRPGFIRKTVTVTSNATNVKGGLVYLKIKGEVIKPDTTSVLEKKKKSVMDQ